MATDHATDDDIASRMGTPRSHRHSYPIALKLRGLELLQHMSIRQVAVELVVPPSVVRNWKRISATLLEFKGNKKSSNLPGAGRPTLLPEPEGLLDFMDTRRSQERALTCSHMINYLKKHHKSWINEYIARQKPGRGYQHLLKLIQQFCKRNGYTHQQACMSKRVVTDLESTRDDFARDFHDKNGAVTDNCVYNVDETGIQFDMPPRYIWAKRGGSSKLAKGEKHSYRMTAVLTIRRYGTKLPILFVIKGQPGGRIESTEFKTYPSGHYYAIQNKAWMDSTVWETYLWYVLAERVEGRSILVLDNFECHVSKEGIEAASAIGYDVCALPANATSHCQPLDVSIMAPFKRHLRDLWIAEDIVHEDDDDGSVPAAVKRITLINRAIKAWDMISPEEVRGSFLKAIPKP